MEKAKTGLFEVVNKMYDPIREVISKENLKIATLGTIAAVYYTSKGFIEYFPKTLIAPFSVPTLMRKLNDRLEREQKNLTSDFGDNPEDAGRYIGGMAAVVPLIPNYHLYSIIRHLDDNDMFLYTFIATNVTSGLYEWYRHTKNKMVAEQKVENQIIVEPNNKLEIAPPQEVNPEDKRLKDLGIKASLKLEELAKELRQI